MTIMDAARRAAGFTNAFNDRRPLWIGLTALTLLVLAIRIYEQIFGWSAGLDSFAPEFTLCWMNVLEGAVPLFALAAVGVAGYLWRTRDRNLASLHPAVELRRSLVLIQLLVLFALALYWGLSFFTEQTAVWHMTAVRDTDFTPSNIITFYVAYPLFAVLGLTAFFYAKTRLPTFANGYSLPFIVMVAGTFMTIPNIGLNEWGHTFWSMDEGFAGPLHWGFVFFGWMTLGVFGLTLQLLGRLCELIGPEALDALRRKNA